MYIVPELDNNLEYYVYCAYMEECEGGFTLGSKTKETQILEQLYCSRV